MIFLQKYKRKVSDNARVAFQEVEDGLYEQQFLVSQAESASPDWTRTRLCSSSSGKNEKQCKSLKFI